MAQKCSICIHPKRQYINRMLMNPKRSLREIAVKYRASQSALGRHRGHISNSIAVAKKNGDIEQGKTTYEQYEELMTEAKKKYRKATGMIQVAWFREWRAIFETALKRGVEEGIKRLEEERRSAHQEEYSDMSPAIKELIDAEFIGTHLEVDYEVVDEEDEDGR